MLHTVLRCAVVCCAMLRCDLPCNMLLYNAVLLRCAMPRHAELSHAVLVPITVASNRPGWQKIEGTVEEGKTSMQ